MKINGLELIKLDSTVEKFPVINYDELASIIEKYFSEKALVVAYLDYTVLIGTWQQKQFHFYDSSENLQPKYIQKMRVFDSEMELLVWRISNGLKGRLRKDDLNGSGTEAVIAKLVLFGTQIVDRSDSTYTEITEERGTTLILPFTGLKLDNKKNRIFIKTLNYIDYNKVNQATYVDCRFICFTDGQNDLK